MPLGLAEEYGCSMGSLPKRNHDTDYAKAQVSKNCQHQKPDEK